MNEKQKFKVQLTKAIAAEEYRSKIEAKKEKLESTNNMLDQVSEMLFEETKRLKELDITKKEESETEILRGNALSNTSKTLLQTIGVHMTVQKHIGI